MALAHESALGPTPLLTRMLADTVERFPHRPAMDFLGRRWSYRHLGRLVDAAAAGLQTLGVGPGVHVGLCLPNTPYSVILFYAVLKTGGTVVNYNPLYTARELSRQIQDSNTTIMAVPDVAGIQDKVGDLMETTGLKTLIVCPLAQVMPAAKALGYRLTQAKAIAPLPKDPAYLTFDALTRKGRTPVPVPLAAGDLAVLQYTGGTTGTPKGAMLTHGNLAANTVQTMDIFHGHRSGEERLVAVLPLFHVFAMTAVMNCSIYDGSEILLLPRFEVKSLLKLIARRRATVLHAVPTIYNAINTAADKGGPITLRSIRFCISGGAPLPVEVADHFREITGAILSEGYGLSETSPVVCCNSVEGGGKPGSVGRPVIGTVVEIRDPAEPAKRLPPGEKGEVCVQGPQVMAGYWNRPDDTEAVFVDGFLRTGDIGYLDDQGYLFLVDRIKDVIISSGYKIYPRVIEEALYTHPAVREALVIAVPDAYRGQAPAAYVSLRPEATATPEDLQVFLAGLVSKIELPREVIIRADLPKTAIGKPSKRDLIAELHAKDVSTLS